MIQNAKKKALFLIGMILTGAIGIISSNIKSNYSKDDSLFATKAYADLAAWSNGWDADHCGGCTSACGMSRY